MLDAIIRTIVKFILRLRYRIRIKGLKSITAEGKEKILFLPNHPAYIDPVILYAFLHKDFRPFGYGHETHLNRPVVRYFTKRWGVRTLPDFSAEGSAAREEVRQKIQAGVKDLKKGGNIIIWPAGMVKKSRHETLGANSAVETLLKGCPEARVILIRTRGLWGSVFSLSDGQKPKIKHVFLYAAKVLLKNIIFFTPRREVIIEMEEPDDFPRQADRHTINLYLENFYNRNAWPNKYVPYTIWEKLAGGQVKTLPEPARQMKKNDTSQVPNSIRETVTDYLKELSGYSRIEESNDLAADLGLDSLSKTDIFLWLEKEFGFPQTEITALKTVDDVILAAGGQFFNEDEKPLRKPGKKWFSRNPAEQIELFSADTINQAFLAQAAARPGSIAAADQISGEKTYRQLVLSCLALQPLLQEMESDRIGIMMPASVGATVICLATLFSGKTPVMVNWTIGPGPVDQCLNSVNAGKIITSKKVFKRLREQGLDFSAIEKRLIFIENLGNKITKLKKLKALLASFINWSALRSVKPPDDAVILFTSGSETMPKAVPLTHHNILSNIKDVISLVDIEKREKIIGFLPPFHSFGLTCTIFVPLLCGASVVFHPNPMQTGAITRIVSAYQVNIIMGTPTFLKGIIKSAQENQLESLRLAVTGAEKCSEEVYSKTREKCPNAIILEGYGVTECSPIITLNDLHNPVQGSIGRVLPSFEYRLLDPESYEPITPPGRGILVVDGPSVFHGYLNNPEKEPFLDLEGKKWYDTGDLVYEDENKVLFFQARLKRFVKLGGEMISLPAIESTLNNAFLQGDEEEPIIAVEANVTAAEPEIILFTAREEITREKANNALRKAGMSGLQNIRRVENIEKIPLLGTGKIDYRSLKKLLL